MSFPVFTLSLSPFTPVYSPLSHPYTISTCVKGGAPMSEKRRLAELTVLYLVNILVILAVQWLKG